MIMQVQWSLMKILNIEFLNQHVGLLIRLVRRQARSNNLRARNCLLMSHSRGALISWGGSAN